MIEKCISYLLSKNNVLYPELRTFFFGGGGGGNCFLCVRF